MTRRTTFLVALPLPLALVIGAATVSGSATPQAGAKKTVPKPKAAAASPAVPPAARAFLKANCYACHSSGSQAGNLDLTTLAANLDDGRTFAQWVKVHDRVKAGEMPPKGAAQPTPAARDAFLMTLLARPMIVSDAARARREGRATQRRMNRYEYENTVRDLLDAPWLQIRDRLPEDGEAFRFNKIGDALDVSYVQVSRYLAAAEYALREAMAQQATRPQTVTKRFYAREQRSFVGPAKFTEFNGSAERATFPILGNAADVPALMETAPMTVGDTDPARREQEAMGVVASAYEPLEPKFDRFRAPIAGRYKLRMRAHSFWAAPESPVRWWQPSRTNLSAGRTREPVTLYAERPPRQLRRLGSFDVGPTAAVAEMDVYLLKGETIRPDAARLFRSRPPGWRNPLAQKDGQPGVAFRWLEVTGPIYDAWPGRGHRLLFGDLPLRADARGAVEVVANDPDADAARLLRGFMARAYRRPPRPDDLAPFLGVARAAREAGVNFTDAMITAYSAVLCSPAFVTLEERPGPLDDHALAARLSYFLWNSEPDARLRALADRGALRKPGALRAQAKRMLADARSRRFEEAFLDYWLDLRKVNNVSPDEVLYPDYYLDDFLVESALDETRAFFEELVRSDLPARNLVISNFAMINGRLAALYGVSGVQGAAIRRVALPADSPRGGLLTQASILKVTANGTTTSPVLRGVWINERILGQPVPPPPAAVPAVEPDTRGATTIREQLAKHRTEATCNSCHTKIDPPGFALENFDVVGGWRDRYRALGDGGEKMPGRGKNGQPFMFHAAQSVDASGTLPDGRRFGDVRALKRLLVSDERAIARNLARQLVTYATGAPVRFGDRPEIEHILDRSQATDYGVRSIIYAILDSELFRNK